MGTTVGLWLYDLSQPDSEPVLAHPDETYNIEFSPDSSLIAYDSPILYLGAINSDLTITDVNIFVGIGAFGQGFSPDGEYIAFTDIDRNVRLWHINTGEEIILPRSTDEARYEGYVGVAFSHDGETVLTTYETVAYLWGVETGQLLESYPIPAHRSGYVPEAIVGFNTADQPIRFQLAYDGFYDVADLFNAHIIGGESVADEDVPVYDLEGEWLTNMSISPDGQLLITGSGFYSRTEVSVRVWDLATGQLHSHIDFVHDVSAIAIDTMMSRLAVATRDGRVRIWNLSDVLALPALDEDTADIIIEGFIALASEITFSPDSRLLVAVSRYDPTDRFRIWDTTNYTLVDSYAVGDQVYNVVVNPSDSTFYVGGQTRDAPPLWYHYTSQFDFEGNRIGTFATTDYPVADLAISADGEILAIATGMNIELWDVSAGTQIRQLVGHNASVETLAFSPTRHVLASGDADGWIYLWDVRTGIRLSSFDVPEGRVYEIAFSPDGETLVSASLNTLHFLNANNLQPYIVYQDTNFDTLLDSVSYHPDGNLVAATIVYSNWASTLLIDPSNGSLLFNLYSGGAATGAVFSPDGRLLAVNSSDGPIYLWSVPVNDE